MRSVNQFAKVEGHNSLVRDMSSNAIIYTDENEFKSYSARREIERKRQQLIEKQFLEIESLKHEMLEIKRILNSLIANKGQ